jgi:hypothetical protein
MGREKLAKVHRIAYSIKVNMAAFLAQGLYAKAHRHPELIDQTIWDNKYSVAASAVGRPSKSRPMPTAS